MRSFLSLVTLYYCNGAPLLVNAIQNSKINISMREHNIIKSGEGKDYDYSQDHCFVKLAFSETNRVCSMVEDQVKPGFYLERH